MVDATKGTLTWAAANESRWYTTECCGENHRFLLNTKLGLFFDAHASAPAALNMESLFLPREEWSACHCLSRWFCGTLKLRKAQVHKEEDIYGIAFEFMEVGMDTDKKNFGTWTKTCILWTDGLGVSLMRSFVQVIDAQKTPFVWVWKPSQRSAP